ncbi:hypothetical protein A3J90_01990 [candidate division WOR-1 bacterium RIFOXYC2_FULL_37_10]|uniref:Uncharacterized protein n=1 Tax=candidate division WOR-1 bacterium RIFOXYB2_FULL_37_13 TaxID=1802579 RepID=A0A1F4SUF7_UNCSA|nr:MAG: hypothetical protein A2246_03665 [candidate division WOR-1 bacterium RIFOXYA2_FULL_37_7]OGC23997.1 MAG: hypothetical protein A2310_05580 [candidate division WOR-1 bacterium RIFOXYB2_FULL_37_13]OGC33923.1 MAG: hypothetical protein A3J90_01990 [candidate division WOR-1 bacterium RIFOXYC2_FULL_37_10]
MFQPSSGGNVNRYSLQTIPKKAEIPQMQVQTSSKSQKIIGELKPVSSNPVAGKRAAAIQGNAPVETKHWVNILVDIVDGNHDVSFKIVQFFIQWNDELYSVGIFDSVISDFIYSSFPGNYIEQSCSFSPSELQDFAKKIENESITGGVIDVLEMLKNPDSGMIYYSPAIPVGINK